jgi:hypothetical protein
MIEKWLVRDRLPSARVKDAECMREGERLHVKHKHRAFFSVRHNRCLARRVFCIATFIKYSKSSTVTLSSMMLQRAVQKASFSSSMSKNGSALLFRSFAPSCSVALGSHRFHSTTSNYCCSYSEHSTRDSLVPRPEPMLAVAYDFDDDEVEEDSTSTMVNSAMSTPADKFPCSVVDDVSYTEIHVTSTNIKNSAGGRLPLLPTSASTSTTFAPPSIADKAIASKRSAGGGGGRYLCPKCGTHVTFRHADFEENTFYCATCSGWFLITPSTITADSTATKIDVYSEFPKTEENKPQDPHILMQHVSSSVGI